MVYLRNILGMCINDILSNYDNNNSNEVGAWDGGDENDWDSGSGIEIVSTIYCCLIACFTNLFEFLASRNLQEIFDVFYHRWVLAGIKLLFLSSRVRPWGKDSSFAQGRDLR